MSAAAVATWIVVTASAAARSMAAWMSRRAHALPLAGLAHRHVLDLRLLRVTGAGQLEVADDLAVRYGHQDAAGVDVGVEFRGGILEQHAQAVPWPAVGLDADAMGRTSGHHASSMTRSRRQRR